VSELEEKHILWDSLAELIETVTELEKKVAVLSRVSMFIDFDKVPMSAASISHPVDVIPVPPVLPDSFQMPVVYELIEDDPIELSQQMTASLQSPPSDDPIEALQQVATSVQSPPTSCANEHALRHLIEEMASEMLDKVALPIYVEPLHKSAMEQLWHDKLASTKGIFLDDASSVVPAMVAAFPDELDLSAGSLGEAQLRSMMASVLTNMLESYVGAATPSLTAQLDLLRKPPSRSCTQRKPGKKKK